MKQTNVKHLIYAYLW